MQAAIFDCFGVVITDVLQAICSQLNLTEPDKANRIIDAVAAANKGLYQPNTLRIKVAKILGISVNEYVEQLKSGEIKDQKLLDFVASLRGRYKTAMLTNIGSVFSLQSRFKPNELSKYFDVVVVSGDIGYAKPEAPAYEITADRLGVRLNECIMIDDRDDYCRGALSVGMQAIQYKSFEQMKSELQKLLLLP